MAKQSAYEAALAAIDRDIADLTRARERLVAANEQPPQTEKPKRTRRKRAGLPEQTNGE